ncbi:uncharacterized protein BHQ10_004624 [Talaromyces amestolkiae]|uniref:Phospholipase/carboxylesterase/thioesterase domain-containing protein n=1 Tax=Talaromyces amestolkiae TaxID=1196081 RepID=A0A364KYI3_TALAM|nr:uncharacterized protein BHQ10_004624 [Talaromyces amestolkiae]RAO68612.1 hypothetical protein BHQ10_004624 [Talaromyces amestolkiae]
MSAKQRFPKPLVVGPLKQPLKQTLIWLHGRGSSGPEFGPDLLTHAINPNGSDTLVTRFPHAHFVFPSAPLSRAHVYNRSLTHQWFNNWKLDPPAQEREHLQVPGLQETTKYLHTLIAREIEMVPGGAGSVILGGLSQGCAAALVAALLWEGDDLGAVVGMCGWLPFAGRMQDVASTDEDDLFERDDNAEDKAQDAFNTAVEWLREELDIPARSKSDMLKRTPVFLGHGVEDDGVDVWLGRKAASCLKDLGVDVCWKEYEQLAHWYSENMLGDLDAFLQSRSVAQ